MGSTNFGVNQTLISQTLASFFLRRNAQKIVFHDQCNPEVKNAETSYKCTLNFLQGKTANRRLGFLLLTEKSIKIPAIHLADFGADITEVAPARCMVETAESVVGLTIYTSDWCGKISWEYS